MIVFPSVIHDTSIVGVGSFVTLSISEVPVSEVDIRSGAFETSGAIVSSSIIRIGLGEDSFPEVSISV